MFRWLSSRVYIWTSTPSGWLIIIAGPSPLILIPWMAWRRWKRYQPQLHLASTVMVLSPLVLPYLDSRRTYLLLILRFLIPIAALGFPLLFHLFGRLRRDNRNRGVTMKMRLGVIAGLLLGFFLVPEYHALQGVVESEFDLTDSAASRYEGGRIICDRPSLVYRFVHLHVLSRKTS